MLSTTDDLRIRELKELTTPQEVMREIPRTLTATRIVMAARNAIHAILHGIRIGTRRNATERARGSDIRAILVGIVQNIHRQRSLEARSKNLSQLQTSAGN